MRQDQERGHTRAHAGVRMGRTGEMPTVRVARGGAETGVAGGVWGSGEHTARMRRCVQRGWRRLGFRRQFLMLLVAATLLSTLGTVSVAYVGARMVSISNAQSRIRRDLGVAEQVLKAHGDAVSLRDGQLFTDDGSRLNSDDGDVGEMGALTGDGAALYELESGQLVGIAGNLTGGQSAAAAVGQPLTGPAAATLLRSCAAQTSQCRVTYAGVVTIQGHNFIAGFAPLDDSQGHLVGALGVVTPLDAIEMPLRLLAGLLLLVGLLMTGVFIVIGYRISGPVSRRAVRMLSRSLDDVSVSAGRLERMSQRQTARSEHQVSAAQDIVAELRKLSDLAEALEHGTNLLRESTSQMWAEMSYPAPNAQAAPGMPGGMPTSAAAMRQTTVAASQIGAAAGQARALCHGLRTRLNQIIAEAGLLSSESLEADSCIESLSEAVQRVEEALGSQAGGAAPGSVNDGLWRRLAFWRGGRALAARVAAARMAAGREDADDEPEMGSTMTGSMRAARGDSGVRWTGRAPTVGHISHAPRPYRSGHTGPQLSARSTGVSRAIPHPATPSGPQASGSHPSPSGHGRMPWYSDEQDLAGAFQEADAHGLPEEQADRSVPPTQQSGGWRGPASGSQSGPRPGNWMNDLR